MEIILSAIFILVIVGWFKLQDGRASNYLNTHVGKIDYEKMNDDRLVNDLSNSQVNKNILNGKYNVSTVKTSETWEDFKKRHPHGSWN